MLISLPPPPRLFSAYIAADIDIVAAICFHMLRHAADTLRVFRSFYYADAIFITLLTLLPRALLSLMPLLRYLRAMIFIVTLLMLTILRYATAARCL